MTILQSERLTLRPLTLDDAEQIEILAGDPDVAKTTSNIPHPYPKGAGKDFVLGTKKLIQSNKLVLFGMVQKKSQDFIGVINLNLSLEHNRAEFGYFVGKEFWGKGYGTEAAQVLFSYGFEQMQLNRIYAATFAENVGSRRIMEKIGLVYEGLFQEHMVRDGQTHDVVYYGLTKTQYEQKSSLKPSK